MERNKVMVRKEVYKCYHLFAKPLLRQLQSSKHFIEEFFQSILFSSDRYTMIQIRYKKPVLQLEERRESTIRTMYSKKRM